MEFLLPVYNLIDQNLLFGPTSVQVDPGGLDALMTQEIGEKGDVPAGLDKIFRKPVAEGVGVEDCRIKTVDP